MSEKCLEICQDCGKTFMAGPNAFFCPDCRKARVAAAARENARKRGLDKIGCAARQRKRTAEKEEA